MLVGAGYDVRVAREGGAAIKLHRMRGADLIITDIVMPGMEGIETIRALQSESPKVPIIAISGGARIRPGYFLHIAAALGADATFTKPIKRSEFLQTIAKLLSTT